MSDETTAILTNEAVIAVDQDPLGLQAVRYRDAGDVETWFRPLDGGDWAMVVLNRGASAMEIEFDWRGENVRDDLHGRDAHFDTAVYRVHDLWSG